MGVTHRVNKMYINFILPYIYKVKVKGLCLESRYPRQFSGTLQLPSLVSELTHILSRLPGENAAMQHTKATAYTIHNILFPFHQVPITAGWPEAVWIQSLPKASIVLVRLLGPPCFMRLNLTECTFSSKFLQGSTFV